MLQADFCSVHAIQSTSKKKQEARPRSSCQKKGCSLNLLGDYSQKLFPSMLLEIYHSAGWCFVHFSSSRLRIGASIIRGIHRVFQGSELNKACLNLFMEERKRAWSARPLA